MSKDRDLGFLRDILSAELKHTPKDRVTVLALWDQTPGNDEDLGLNEAAWQYRVELQQASLIKRGLPARVAVNPSKREAELKVVGDCADKLLEALKALDRVSRKQCIAPAAEKGVMALLRTLAKNAYAGSELYAADKAAPNGPRPGKRNLALERLLIELGSVISKVSLVMEVARSIHRWAAGRPSAKGGAPCWVSSQATLNEFGKAPWKQIQAELERRRTAGES